MDTKKYPRYFLPINDELSVIDDHSESINKLSCSPVAKREKRIQPVLSEEKRLKYQGFSKISKQNTKDNLSFE